MDGLYRTKRTDMRDMSLELLMETMKLILVKRAYMLSSQSLISMSSELQVQLTRFLQPRDRLETDT